MAPPMEPQGPMSAYLVCERSAVDTASKLTEPVFAGLRTFESREPIGCPGAGNDNRRD